MCAEFQECFHEFHTARRRCHKERRLPFAWLIWVCPRLHQTTYRTHLSPLHCVVQALTQRAFGDTSGWLAGHDFFLNR